MSPNPLSGIRVHLLINSQKAIKPSEIGVLQRHERVNDSGYPVGLSGENVFLEASIFGT